MEIPAELQVFESLPDLVVAFDSTLEIRYLNPFGRRLLGYGDEALDGRSLVEFVHPDDLSRAAEVAGLIMDESLGDEVTPALYRLLTASGEWCSVEINSTPQFTGGALDDLIVIVGRYSGDNVLQDRILQMLTTGEPIDDIVALLPTFGLWRHPDAQYAVVYPGDDGRPVRVGSDGALDLLARFDGGDTPWAHALRDGRELRHGADDLPEDLRAAAAAMGLRGCMVLPVREEVRDQVGLAIGWSSRPDQDVGAHRYALERMARALDIIMQWRSHRTEMERAAQIDALSGLANRSTFFGHFQRLLAAPRDATHRAAVLYVDLDGFKEVNDSKGHALGDAVIEAVAQRMGAVVRSTDLVARIGGDEFAVLCTVGEVEEVTTMADRIVRTLSEPFHHLDVRVAIGASVGIAIAGDDDHDHDALLAAADRALYEAKAAGKGRWKLA